MDKVVPSAAAAVADVPDGATLLFGGFGVVQGWPNSLLLALRDHGARDLTVIFNTPGVGPLSAQLLAEAGLVRKVIASFAASPTRPTPIEEQIKAGKIELELVPQGTLAERVRAGGAGIPALPSASASSRGRRSRSSPTFGRWNFRNFSPPFGVRNQLIRRLSPGRRPRHCRPSWRHGEQAAPLPTGTATPRGPCAPPRFRRAPRPPRRAAAPRSATLATRPPTCPALTGRSVCATRRSTAVPNRPVASAGPCCRGWRTGLGRFPRTSVRPNGEESTCGGKRL